MAIIGERTLENLELRSELEKLRALEGLRQEHQQALAREVELRASEQKRFHSWVQDFKDRLRCQVWWRGMKNDVNAFYKACLVCATRNGGCKTFRPPLVPIPIGGPFHRVAVDILQLPLTTRGNCYVAVFMNYLPSGQRPTLSQTRKLRPLLNYSWKTLYAITGFLRNFYQTVVLILCLR